MDVFHAEVRSVKTTNCIVNRSKVNVSAVKKRTSFLNTKLCERMNQRHFGGKILYPSSFTTCFSENAVAETHYQIV